jgi:hypothetical protein
MWANKALSPDNTKRFAIIDHIQCINPPGELKSNEKILSKSVKSFQDTYEKYSSQFWFNGDVTGKSSNREFSKIENSKNRKNIWVEFAKTNNIITWEPKALIGVPNLTQSIEHTKSNYSPFIDISFDKNIKFEQNTNDKIAFLFLTRNNLKQPQLWYDFLSDGKDKCNIYVHTKERNKLNQQFLIDNQIPEHIHTEWGHSNLLTATNALIKNALKDPTNKKFLLVSESCIPLYNFEIIYNILFHHEPYKNKSFLYTQLTPKKEDGIHLKDSVWVQVSRNGDPSKELGMTWENTTRNSQWMVLNRKHAEIIIKHNHEDLFKDFYVADEWYYYNVLRHYDPEIEKNTIQYVKSTWFGVDYSQFKTEEDLIKFKKNPNAHPIEFNDIKHIDRIRKEYPSFFIRKIPPNLKIEYKDLFF